MIICCAGCDKPIRDKFLLTVLDRTWHSECVLCTDCRCPLTDKCFSREGKLFCKKDFFRRFGTKCSGCLQGISPQDLVRKARDRVFHLKCFTCFVCRKQLSTGEELYVLEENKFICKHDYLSGKVFGDFPPASDDEDDDAIDVKPNIEANNNSTSTPTSLSSSPQGSTLLPPCTPTGLTSPASHIASPGVTGAPTGLVGLLGRPNTPSAAMGNPSTPNPSGTPIHEPLSVGEGKVGNAMSVFNMGLSETPTSEKEGSLAYHDSECSDNETSNEAKEQSSTDGSKVADEEKSGNKRRGPRATIKAKQLEVLKTAFATTPKPTRHIREQLAKETGLPMRVIQVWFQNKRSKERRMKQLSTMGMRAHLFANPRKMRGMRMSPSMEDGYPYYGEAFYGPQGFPEFFPGQGPPPPPGMGFPHGLPPAMEQPLPPGGPMGDFAALGGLGPPGSEGRFINPPTDILSQRSSPDSMIVNHGGPPPNFDHQVNEGLVW